MKQPETDRRNMLFQKPSWASTTRPRLQRRRGLATLATAALVLPLGACASDESARGSSGEIDGPIDQPDLGGSAGFVVPGAADFGQFRALVQAGKVPAPDILDDLGFYAEHKIDFPKADCGQDLCLHGRVGVMGNLLTGSTCTIVQIGLNSPIDPAKLARPKLHLVLALDTSGSMQGDALAAIQEGIERLVLDMETKHPDDLLTIIRYADQSEVLIAGAKASQSAAITAAVNKLVASGSTNLYEGMARAYGQVSSQTPTGYAARVVLLSDGVATAGLTDDGKARALATAWAAKGVGLTTIGVGSDFDHDLMGTLAEAGHGNAYFLNDSKSVREVFVEEASTAMFPVAAAVTLRLDTGDGWAARASYGARGVSLDDGGATIRIPALYLAHRLSASAPIEGGRRGGGSTIQVELMPLATSLDDAKLKDVGKLRIDWHDIAAKKDRTQAVTLALPKLSAATAKAGLFEDAAVEKGFVMLNLYVALRMACSLARDGDSGAAIGTLDAIVAAAKAWTKANPDADIVDDLDWATKLRDNLQALPTWVQTPVVAPPEPWPVD